MRITAAISILYVTVGVLTLSADQVTLTNGDRVSGVITAVDDKNINLKTDAMGEVKISRSAISSFSSAQRLSFDLAGGRTVVGTVAATDGQESITEPSGNVIAVSTADVQAVRTEREQLRLTHPPLTDFWSGTVDLNLSAAQGNAKTTTLGTGATAQRLTGTDKIGLTFSQLYSTQRTTAPFGATADRISGAARYDHNLGSRMFVFVTNGYDFDRFQALDLRVVLGGGLGVHLYKSKTAFWDVGGGATWNREAFATGLVRKSAEALVYEESSHLLASALELHQLLSVFPDLTRTGEYRISFDGGASIKLTKLLSWNLTLSDRFLSDPLPGKKKNDVLLTTGVGLTFEQK